MTYIKNIKVNKNSLQFEINNASNDFKISFTNALRRIILSDITTWALDEKKIEFIENNSLLNNEFLKHRLSLIPFNNESDKVNYENLVISCSVKNESEDIRSIYVSDFEIYDEILDEHYDIADFVEHTNILFAKLQNNEYFTFNAHFSNNSSYEGNKKQCGAQHCCVSTCIVTFKHDENIVKDTLKSVEKDEKDSFIINNKEKMYKKTDMGNPDVLEMNIESIGFYEVKNILKKGLVIMEEKINSYQDKLKDFEFTNGFYILNLENENDTLGNLVSSYINDEKEILFSGYIIEHPLYENVILKIKTELKKDDLIKVIIKNNNYLKEIINKLIKEIK
jgi:DNA-directed RNA polymerase subunit L